MNVKKKFNILKEVNKVYKEQNPSLFLKKIDNKKKLEKLLKSRKKLLLKLKLHPKIFKNSKLIELGSGSGQNTLVFDTMGADCTLVEYDKNSYLNSLKLFKKYAKNQYNIINKDLFKFKTKKKYDVVVSNGVAHHTVNPKKNLDICCKLLKKEGFLLIGICLKSGWFQRNLQRAILYNLSEDKNDLIVNSKILFKENLIRSEKFGGRNKFQVIFDTYVNPKINSLELEDIVKIFRKNNVSLFSTFNYDKFIKDLLTPEFIQHRQFDKKRAIKKDLINLSKFHEFSLTNNKPKNAAVLKNFKQLDTSLNKITSQFNDVMPNRNMNFSTKNILNYQKEINRLKKVDLIDIEYNKKFLNEVKKILKILNLKLSKKNKLAIMRNCLRKSKYIFKKFNGVGINYFVGYKN